MSTIVGEIKDIDKKIINQKYNDLPITNKKEIDISAKEICNLLNKKPNSFLKQIIEDLEYNILNKTIKNKKEVLQAYIQNKYKNITLD